MGLLIVLGGVIAIVWAIVLALTTTLRAAGEAGKAVLEGQRVRISAETRASGANSLVVAAVGAALIVVGSVAVFSGSGSDRTPRTNFDGGDESPYDSPDDNDYYDDYVDNDYDSCVGDCTDMDNDGRTSNDYDADGDGLYESWP